MACIYHLDVTRLAPCRDVRSCWGAHAGPLVTLFPTDRPREGFRCVRKKTAGRHGRGDAVGLPLYPSDVTLMPTPECFWSSEKNCRKLRSHKPCRGVKWQCYSRGAGAHGETCATPPAVFSHAPEWRLFYTQVGKHVDLVTSADTYASLKFSWEACRAHHMHAGAYAFLNAT